MWNALCGHHITAAVIKYALHPCGQSHKARAVCFACEEPPNLQPLHLVEVKIIKYEETVSTGWGSVLLRSAIRRRQWSRRVWDALCEPELWRSYFFFFFLFFVFCSGVLVLRDDVMCSALQLAASNIHIHLTPPMNTTPSHSGRAAYTIHRADMHHHHWHWEGKEGGLKELAFSNHVLSIVGSVEEIKLKTWNEGCCFKTSVDCTSFLRRRRNDGNYQSTSKWLAIVSSWILTSCKLLLFLGFFKWHMLLVEQLASNSVENCFRFDVIHRF